ncbi:outer membrane beta-barrel protein [Polaribacter sp. HL-MS24]|uniref:outer membrane beta-barrel protein n=1 Tax=Polaribacter sp. HL-MS24 TaxID=3077735 RepID=UPI0029345B43|nr:outer membrane beta-barrel protein [Polaribacter sp. HL-MS24]WOC39941.1 outer membrane beta-barrel protein [Polaribacter sp. HL-MS24]
MKRKLTIILLLFIPFIIFSQKKGGIIIGLNNSSISEGILGQVSISDKMGFHIGGFYEYEIKEKIKFRPKITFSQQGNRYESNIPENIMYESNYMNVSLNYKFYESTYILLGPQLGVFLNGNGSSNNNTRFLRSQPFDVGINLGIGKKLKDLIFELNLYQGLTKAIDKPDFNGELKKGTNTLIQFSVGYYLF